MRASGCVADAHDERAMGRGARERAATVARMTSVWRGELVAMLGAIARAESIVGGEINHPWRARPDAGRMRG